MLPALAFAGPLVYIKSNNKETKKYKETRSQKGKVMPMSAIFNTNVKDISFANIFWRKIVIRLFVFLILSIVLFNTLSPVVLNIFHEKVNGDITRLSLDLAQLMDEEIVEDQETRLANVMLSTTQETVESYPFAVDSSISLYNMETKELVSQSSKIPVLCSDSAIEWWKSVTDIKDGAPMISFDVYTNKFCDKYQGNTIYVDGLCCMNNVLYAPRLIAVDDIGKELDAIDLVVPSLAIKYPIDEIVELKIIGNESDDSLYYAMTEFEFKDEPNDPISENKTGETKQDVRISYGNELNDESIKLINSCFTINNTEYQVDCAYQTNLWELAWKYVMIFEIMGILACAVVAFINTKETMSIYQ